MTGSPRQAQRRSPGPTGLVAHTRPVAGGVAAHPFGRRGVPGASACAPAAIPPEGPTRFRVAFWALPNPFFPAYALTYSPNHVLIGLFPVVNWAGRGQGA